MAASPTPEPRNNDASLKSLETSLGSPMPSLYGGRTSFVVQVAHATESASVTAAPTDARATLRIAGKPATAGTPAGPFKLAVGRNVCRVEVTAADGKTKAGFDLKFMRAAPVPDWERVTEAAPFAARDSSGELVFKDRMYILGGYTPELVTDVWGSADGKAWDMVGKVPDEAGINIPVNFSFAGKMWIAGNTGKLWSSPDGAVWTLVTEKAPWSGRYGAGSAVFRGRMWVAGGFKDGELFNDVWSSVDGVEWRQETADAPWSRRQLFGNLVSFRERLYVVGGGVTVYQPFRAYADVWSSIDGKSWERVTDEAPWPVRIWSSCIVYRGRIWLLGGFRGQPTWNNFDDVWHTADGRTWERFNTPTIWSARHELSAYVLHESLWVVAGNAWPLVNDVWRLHLPGMAFTTQPVLEEFIKARYSYTARAEFNVSGGAVRYRMTKGPDWLTLDARNGRLRGVAPALGEYPVVLEAFDDAGEVVTQEFRITVIPIGTGG
ncbi:MAG: cadherin-like beta sandwich domain-containing protein [Planctomycetota bacterium]|nr:cadherin-like beta sandwich domain-containing protein [Planctomycetota bacterium]